LLNFLAVTVSLHHIADANITTMAFNALNIMISGKSRHVARYLPLMTKQEG